jgi:hypothetical protein
MNRRISSDVIEDMNSSKNSARLAGLLYLLAAVTGGFGLFYIRSKVIVPGDAAATVANIMASEFLFRAAIVGTLLSQIFLFFFGLTLFQLFKEVNKVLATVFLTSVMMTVGIAVVNQLNNFGALLVLSQADRDSLKYFGHRIFLRSDCSSSDPNTCQQYWAFC